MKKKSKGFTLVELIVVIAILVILAAILIPTMTGVIDDAKEATACANARSVYTAAMAYFASEKLGEPATITDTSVLAEYLGSNFSGTYSVTVTSGVVKTTWTSGETGAKTYTFIPGGTSTWA